MSLASAATLRISKDIIVEQVQGDELVVMCREPGVRDERLSVHFPDAEASAAVPVTVAESRPVVLEGAVRYRLHLRVNRETAQGGEGDSVCVQSGESPGADDVDR